MARTRNRGRGRGRSPWLRKKVDWVVSPQGWLGDPEEIDSFQIAPADGVQGLQLTWPPIRADVYGALPAGTLGTQPWRPRKALRVRGTIYWWQQWDTTLGEPFAGILRFRLVKCEYDWSDGTIVSTGVDDLFSWLAADQDIIWQRDVIVQGPGFWGGTAQRQVGQILVNARVNRTLEPNETLAMLVQSPITSIPGFAGSNTANWDYRPFLRTAIEV